MAYSQVEIREYCRKLGKSESTLWRWIRQGCDLGDPKSVAEWVTRNTIRETNISKAQKRRRDGNQAAQRTRPARDPGAVEHSGNGELAAPGRRGAAHALARLELQEEESYRRLQAALASGDPFAVDAAQSFWLRVAEVLRRLDRELELSRRSEQEMIPLKDATDAIVAVSEWTRIALVTLLSAEGVTLAAGFKSIGEFKAYFVQRLHGVLTLTIKAPIGLVRRFRVGQSERSGKRGISRRRPPQRDLAPALVFLVKPENGPKIMRGDPVAGCR